MAMYMYSTVHNIAMYMYIKYIHVLYCMAMYMYSTVPKQATLTIYKYMYIYSCFYIFFNRVKVVSQCLNHQLKRYLSEDYHLTLKKAIWKCFLKNMEKWVEWWVLVPDLHVPGFQSSMGGYVSTRPTCIHVPGFQSSIGRGGGGGWYVVLPQ